MLRTEEDPKFKEAVSRITALEKSLKASNRKLDDAANRQRQVQSAMTAVNIDILLGKATEADADRLKAERENIDGEMTKLRASILETQERLRGTKAALAQLEAELRRAARQRSMVAYRDAVERLTPLLKEASMINEEMWGHFDQVNLPGLPGPWSDLRNIRDLGRLHRWLEEARTFDWAEYGA